jgi:DNA invertase Pin-like site-specific DNA recombinase
MTRRRRTGDGYIRVSRRAGREGESFISPEVQRKKIADWAKLHEVEIVRWWEEIDQSGAKLERPQFQEALARCERGETGGIVVARLDRFARSAIDALESIRRLNEAGARLVSVEDNFDGSTPMGRFAIGILTLIAELELERIKENWASAVSSAVARGVHISARVPTGYRRDDQRRLYPEEPAASAVRELFRRRAAGASWAELARYLEDAKVYPSTGNEHWSLYGVSSLVKNPVYLGQARSGKVVNEQAHEPLVTRAEFDAAQLVSKSLLKQRDGSVASQAMLGGLARCAGCGHTLKITGNTKRSTGERYPVYYCTGRYASGPCPARATVRASLLDEHVEQRVLAALSAEGGLLAQAVEASEAVDEAARAVAEAEHELDLFVNNPTLLTVLGEKKFVEGVEVRQRALDEARAELTQLRAESTFAADLGDGDLLSAWPSLTIQERRRLMHGLLERVVLKRADARGRAAEPIAERAEIVLRGETTLRPRQTTAQDEAPLEARSGGKRAAATARDRTKKKRKTGRTRTRSASS